MSKQYIPMTLTSAVDAVREILSRHKGRANPYQERLDEALAALPDKPPSSDELVDIIIKAWHEGKNKRNDSRAANVIAALHNANVLFVKED